MITTYIVYEVQTDSEGHSAHLPPVDKTDVNEAWGVFYQKLASAATSSVPVHAVFLLTADGRMIQSKTFMHKEEVPNEN